VSAPRLAFYITGHGFGHATRAIAVMLAIHRQAPAVHFHIRSAAPAWVFNAYLPAIYTHTPVRTDVGALEKNILDTDIEQTVANARAFYADIEPVIQSEAAFLRQQRIDTVLFDVPPVAAEIARLAGIPSIAIGNFTWDYIYDACPGLEAIADQLRAWQAHATLALQTPMGHDLTAFPRREAIPLIARQSTADRAALRRELELKAENGLVLLLAFRGMDLGALGFACDDPSITLLSFGELPGAPNVRVLDDQWQRRFTDVLSASDLVLSKPGYGIISECYANRRPLLHLPRTRFAETPLLLDWMNHWLPNQQITPADLQAGRLPSLARDLAARHHPWNDQPTNGAEVAATRILSPSQ
jgi:hypothetical protein